MLYPELPLKFPHQLMINTRLLLLKRGMDQWMLVATMAQLPKVYNVFKGVSVIGQVHKGPWGLVAAHCLGSTKYIIDNCPSHYLYDICNCHESFFVASPLHHCIAAGNMVQT